MGKQKRPVRKAAKVAVKKTTAAKKSPAVRSKAKLSKSPRVIKGLTFAHPHFALHHPDIQAKMLLVENTATDPAKDDERQIKFDVADGSSYEHLRVTLDYIETVIYDDTNVPSKPRPNGRLVSVLIEIMGSPGNKVILNVSNAVPKQLTCEIGAGATSNAKTQTLRASW